MKKLISVLLVVLLLFALCSCGKESSENSMETNETTQITEDKTTEDNKTDGIDNKQENNTDTTTESTQNQEKIPDETTKSENNVGNKKENFDKNSTTSAPENTDSGNKKPNENNGNTVQSNTNQENKTEEKAPSKDKVYFEKFEYVSRTFAYPYYIDGKNLVNKLYGDKCMQTNDTVTYRIVMSDGGTSGFKIIDEIGANISINGNLVTISANGTDTEAGFTIETNDKNGNTIVKSLVYDVVKQDYCIVESEVGMYVHLKNYAMSKGLNYYNGNALTGYTVNDETLSITNYNKKGADDYVPIKAEVVNGKYIFGNADWVKKVIWVIDKYAEMGFTKWSFDVIYLDGFQSVAE